MTQTAQRLDCCDGCGEQRVTVGVFAASKYTGALPGALDVRGRCWLTCEACTARVLKALARQKAKVLR